MVKYAPEEVSRKDITIAGVTYSAPLPYNEGHVLTAGEAAALNQVLHENVRNNMALRVNKAKEELQEGKTLEEDALRAEFEAYAQAYEFGTRNAGGSSTPRASLDPVEREALNMAKALVRQALKANNYSIKVVGEEKIGELAKELLANNPAITEQAKSIVESRKQVGSLSLTGLSLAPAPAPTMQAPAAEPTAETQPESAAA